MSYDGLLPHTAEVRRDPVQKDRFGQPRTSPQTIVGAYSCRLTNGSGGERYTDRSREVVVRSYVLFLPTGVDITEADTVTVRDRTGRVLVQSGDVTDVTVPEDWLGPHHTEAKVQQTRKAQDAPT